MLRRYVPGVLICSLGMLGQVGCQSNSAPSMDSALFFPPGIGAAASTDPIDRASASGTADTPLPAAARDDQPKNAAILPAVGDDKPLADIKPLEALKSPATMPAADVLVGESAAPAIPAAAVISPIAVQPPAAIRTSPGQGVYMTLGGVLAIVNGTPIYADKVLARLDREFTAKARDMDPREFHDFAEDEILRQLHEMQEDELYFGTAYNALSEDDRKLAQQIAMHVRQEKVTAAGGSVAEARKKSLDEGIEFDDAVQQEYRHLVYRLYEEKQIEPLIEVTAEDMREYYRLNVDKRYTDADKSQFRVIMIDPAKHGGLQPAMDLINSLRDKAMTGADFAALASSENDVPFLKSRGGSPRDPGEWTPRNSYPVDALEAALWKIEPGQITPVVQANNLLYIGKLEAKHIGGTKSFDDAAVQDDIYQQLYQTQHNNLWKKRRDESIAGGMVDTDRRRLQAAVDMAMQKYAQAH